MEYLCNKEEIAGYISKKYFDIYKKRISPIKLQKTLYFLFAEVSAKTSLITEENDKVAYLFDAKFEAWPYGPVDKDIYRMFKYEKLKDVKNLNVGSNIIEYVDELINEIFKLSDFRLVDLSHEDKEWSKKIKSDTKVMSNEEILADYINV